ncbi:ADP-ribose pyrophosphatase [Thalassobacillus cyri]|uniref:ADP-ribose pyrophosphatase n=1 Tax=Thalassobacillus cyri TaxID=571932 RepID=A0A1H4CEX8_9BACI|nr:NUDIX hydrolase [Thalassobacillus cyri]SEA58869.1 ADP-ribose pyrophosphatase [Thalassobacillus cyri]
MKKFEEKTIATEKIFNGKVIKLQVDSVTLPDGNTSKRELIKHPGAVAIIALTDENNIVFVEQYRKALEKSILEIPAGKLEEGEAPEVTAKRELEEETGYTTEHMEMVTSFYTSPGFADELVYVYFTDQLQRLDDAVAGDEDEFVEVYELPLEEAERLMAEQRIHDAKTAYALLYLKNRRV